eukprot:TRINITY_DN3737_c0_g1_i1.p3 TRINITY_DN3737_c0_g1~~TRINITY_DN3737_c0_g1_i1.p3  ORF type:complete len:106 (-),score=6.16 TRINITY_DN3737_c0_g1_i1:262-579(-)
MQQDDDEIDRTLNYLYKQKRCRLFCRYEKQEFLKKPNWSQWQLMRKSIKQLMVKKRHVNIGLCSNRLYNLLIDLNYQFVAGNIILKYNAITSRACFSIDFRLEDV